MFETDQIEAQNVQFHATPICLVSFSTWKPGRKVIITQEHQFTSSLKSGSRVNHRATAHLCPLVTALTPCGFSPPDEKPTILPHLGFTDAWRGRRRRSRNQNYNYLSYQQEEHFTILYKFSLVVKANILFTVTVLASISVNMNSPPSKSPFRYNSALEIEKIKQRSVQTQH